MKKKFIISLALLTLFSFGAGEISLAATAESKAKVIVRTRSKRPVVRSGTTVKKTTSTAQKTVKSQTAVTKKNTAAKKVAATKKSTTQKTVKTIQKNCSPKTVKPAEKVTGNEAASTVRRSAASPSVEVGLLLRSEVTLTGLSDFRAEADGKVIGTYGSGTQLSITRSGDVLSVNGKKAGAKVFFKTGNSNPAFAVKGNRYRGVMKAIASSSGVTLVNKVSMEDYLKGVVPCEIVPSWKMDAIKAQAVAARTYAMFHKDGYRSAGYDMTDDTRSQVYRGASAETEATNRAVMETAGEIVTYNGKPIDAVFHASGGGYTEDCENVWGSSVPYLKGVKEEKYAEPWKETVSTASLANIAGVGSFKSIKLSNLEIGEAHHSSDRGVSGRVKSVTVVGSRGSRSISGDSIMQAYDLNSTLFDISVKGGSAVITGYGYGHGLGLSQWGAEAMAEKSGNEKDFYKKILTHYFTGTKVENGY